MANNVPMDEAISTRTVMTRSAIRKERKDNIEVVKFFESLEECKTDFSMATIMHDNGDKNNQSLIDEKEENEHMEAVKIIEEQKKIYDEILKNTITRQQQESSYDNKRSKNKDCIEEEFASSDKKSANNNGGNVIVISSSNNNTEKNIDNKKENEKKQKLIPVDIPKKEDKNVTNKQKYNLMSGDEKYNTIQELINDARLRRKMSESNRKH